MKSVVRILMLIVLSIVVAACGRRISEQELFAPPPPPPTAEVQASTDEEPVPSDASEEETVAEETVEPVEVAMEEDVADDIILDVRAANAARGEQLFNQPTSAGFACSNCHNANSDIRLVGPGLLGLPQYAPQRVADEVAERYIYNSILHPNDYIVAEYPENVMPAIYADIYTEQDVLDLVAYLMTLNDPALMTPEPAAVAQEASTEEAASDTAEAEPTAQAATPEPVVIVVTATPTPQPEEDVAQAEAEEATEEVATEAPQELQLFDPAGTPDIAVTLSSFGLVFRGEALYETECAACHAADSAAVDGENIGLLGIPNRVAARDLDTSVHRYLFEVTGAGHAALGVDLDLSDAQLYDLVAYMLTLEDSGEAMAEDASGAGPGSGFGQEVVAAVASADAAHGEAVFNMLYPETGFACSTCHYSDQEGMLVGPGLLNISQRGPGVGPVEAYLYNSIINPNEYIVEGYPQGVMPQTYADVLSEQDVYDLVAYLLTLND